MSPPKSSFPIDINDRDGETKENTEEDTGESSKVKFSIDINDRDGETKKNTEYDMSYPVLMARSTCRST